MLKTKLNFEKYCLLLDETEQQLNFLNVEEENILKRSEGSIAICLKSFEKIKKLVLKSGFKNHSEEIYFFKEIKPLLISKLIFNISVYNIESRKPQGSDKVQCRYFLNELDKLKRYFDNNLEFYKYYRTGSNYLDHKYFLRGNHDIRLTLDTFFFETDAKFNTSHDYKVSKILANDLLEVYLKDKLAYIDRKEPKQKPQDFPSIKLNWTHSKTSLIELIYALHTQAVFDNGKAEIKDIASYLEAVFTIDLGDYYRTYLELRMRKTAKTKFIDTIRDALHKRMDELEEK